MKGSCFCETVQFSITGSTPDLYQCHCSECRKTTGVSANAGFIISEKQLEWLKGQDNIKTYIKDSGYRVDFCKTCGSVVPSPASVKPEMMWIPAGLLDNPPVMKVGNHLFVGSKASWDEIQGSANQHENLPPSIDVLL